MTYYRQGLLICRYQPKNVKSNSNKKTKPSHPLVVMFFVVYYSAHILRITVLFVP